MSKRKTNTAKTPSSVITSPAPKELHVTAYLAGNAVVHETRELTLKAGANKVQLAGLPETYVDETLEIHDVRGEGSFDPGTDSYEPATFNDQAVIEASVGQDITFFQGTQKGLVEVTGKIKKVVGNRVYLTMEDGSLRALNITSDYSLPSGEPDGLADSPSVLLEPNVEKAGNFELDLSYEAEGITWAPRYVAYYDATAKKLMRLRCKVRVTNGSGADQANARYTLIAGANTGSPQRGFEGSYEAVPQMAAMGGSRSARKQALPQADYTPETAEAGTLGDQPTYTLPRALSLKAGATKHPILLYAEAVPVEQEYYLDRGGYREAKPGNEDDLPKLSVKSRLRGSNDEASNLGDSLPAGPVKLLECDKSGKWRATNSAQLALTAEGEPFKLDLAKPSRTVKALRLSTYDVTDPEPEEVDEDDDQAQFPVRPLEEGPQAGLTAAVFQPPTTEERLAMVERAVGQGKKKEKKPEPRFREQERKVVLFNAQDEDVVVKVHEDFPENAQFLSKSQDFASQTQTAGVFALTVPAKTTADGGKTKVGRVEVTYRIKWQIN